MKIKAVLAIIVLSVSPALAGASCKGEDHAKLSCASGTTYDAKTNACVPVSG